MRRISRMARRLRSDAGYTLVEVTLASVLGLLVIGAAGTVMTAAVRSEPKATSRAAGVQQARFVIDRMTREIRLGLSAPSSTASQLSLVTYVDEASCGGAGASTAIVCRVTYSCAGGACTRTVAQPDGTSPGPTRTVVSGLSSASIFGYGANCAASSTNPAYVCVTLPFAASDGANAITLRDGVALRNS